MRILDTDRPGIRVEPVTFCGEQRFRFWYRSPILGCCVSDGGMYRTIREAADAGAVLLAHEQAWGDGPQN